MTLSCIHGCRKADLRELKLLQKIENKQHQDLILKAQYLTDQQARKFEQEMQVNEPCSILCCVVLARMCLEAFSVVCVQA